MKHLIAVILVFVIGFFTVLVVEYFLEGDGDWRYKDALSGALIVSIIGYTTLMIELKRRRKKS